MLVTGTKKLSYPLTQALARWKKEFDDTKSGERESSAAFRFSQRLGDATTAHETAILLYSFRQGDGEMKHEFIHLEALLLKKDETPISPPSGPHMNFLSGFLLKTNFLAVLSSFPPAIN